MDAPPGSLSLDDDTQLRLCLRDLLVLAALPAVWASYESQEVADSVAGSLLTMLGLEFIHVAVPPFGIAVTLTREKDSATHRSAVAQVLAPFLGREAAFQVFRIENPLGAGPVQLLLFPIGFVSAGMIALASSDPGFPSEAQRLLVNVASNQMAIVLQRIEAHDALRGSEERLQQLANTLEERVAERSRQLEAEIAERHRAEDALRQAQKMEALGQLTGGVAHDFNNLLMVIGGNLELLQRRSPLRSGERELGSIARAVERGQSLTRQLLAFSRQQPLSPRVIDTARELPTMVDELLRHSLRGDIEVETCIAPDCWSIMVDPTEFEIAILNIAVNARDAMPSGGRVTIVVANESGAKPSGDMVAIAISDTGVGIPAAELPRVFEPFFTTKESGRGTGLGLSQVYGFAEQSGGTVRIASRPGEGTTVSLHLPRWQGAPEAAVPRRDAQRGGRSKGAHILVVEDNDEVAEITQLLLREEGFETTRLTNARAAIERIANSGGVDLILSDVVMPGGMTGLDLARAARARSPALPVLLMSGYSRSAQAAIDEGFSILSKPFQREHLLDHIQRLLPATEHDAAH